MKYKSFLLVISVLFFISAQSQVEFGSAQFIIADHWGNDGMCCVYTADFDGDGDMDVLSASERDNAITWHENLDGKGEFFDYQVVTTKTNGVSSIYAADFDNDGDMDVLSGSINDNKIAWYKNTDGKGTFGSQRIISQYSMHKIKSVYASDIDGDGDMDVLATSSRDSIIAWFENLDGHGTFSTKRIISTNGTYGSSINATDFDGDGDMDILVVLNVIRSIAWLENLDGNGTFGSIQIITDQAINTESTFPADIDGDGDMDVIWACAGNPPTSENSKIAWCENIDGNGTFGPSQIISTDVSRPKSIYATDIDNDGDLDVLSASWYDDKIAWYENSDGQGNFHPQQIISSNCRWASSIHAEDIDGDGDMDVLATSFRDNKTVWYENQDSNGNFGSPRVINLSFDGVKKMIVTDMDFDNDLDILTVYVSNNRIIWIENKSGLFNKYHITGISGAEHNVFIDIDNDDDLDVLTANETNHMTILRWYENIYGNDTFNIRQTIDEPGFPFRSIYASDIDGDGDNDVIASWTTWDNMDLLEWFENIDGDGTFYSTPPGYFISWGDESLTGAIKAADMDGDIDQDVVFYGNGLEWRENLGHAIFRPFVKHTVTSTKPNLLFVLDLDGDNDKDILLRDLSYHLVWIENLDGMGNFGPEQSFDNSYPIQFQSVFPADVDGDGDIDIVTGQQATWNSYIGWYENTDGLGTFSSHKNIAIETDKVNIVLVVDFDGDGDMDVVASFRRYNKISWYENMTPNSIVSPTTTINSIFIYPNPTTGIVTVDYKEMTIQKLTLTNLMGNVLFTETRLKSPTSLDFSFLPKGAYFLLFETEKKRMAKKLIKY